MRLAVRMYITITILMTATVILAVMQVAACATTDDRKENDMKGMGKVLVVFFSRTGENYAVGYIEKGNTDIVAEMIAARTGGDLFRIEPERPYPDNYRECIEAAGHELETGARPTIKGDIRVEDYDVVFVGYPNWWGDMPMPVYTFIEKHCWDGITVVPFCTHEGSGFGSTATRLAAACSGAVMLDGLAVRGDTAQNSRKQAQKVVDGWLEKLGY